MRIDLDDLPVDTSLLHHLVRDMAAVVESRDSEIERLQLIIKKLQRAQFGRRSERLDPDQRHSLSRTSTAMSRAFAKAIRRSRQAWKKRRARRSPGANRCPIICRARTSGSMSTARRALAAAARSIPSAKA
jgi:hypothetical protein